MCSLEKNTQSENDQPQAGESKDAAGSTDAEPVGPEVPRLEVARSTNLPSQDASHGGATAQTPPGAQAEEPHARNTTATAISTGAATSPPYAIPTSPVQLVGVLWPPVPTTLAGEPIKCSSCSQDRLTTTSSASVGNVTTAATAIPAPAVFVARTIRVASCPPEGRLPPRDAFPFVTSSSSFSTSRVAMLEPNAGAFKPCAAPSLVRLGCQGCGRPEVPASDSCRSGSARAFPICCRLPRATAEIQTDISLPPDPEYIEDFDYGHYITRRIRLYQTDSIYEAKSQLQAEGIQKMRNNTLYVDPACSEAKCYVNLLGWEIDLEDVAATPGEWEQFAIPTPPYAFPEPRYLFQPVLDPDVFMSNIPESEEAAKETHAGPDRARAHKGWVSPSATPHCKASIPRTTSVQAQLLRKPGVSALNQAKGSSPASTRAKNSLTTSTDGSFRPTSAQSRDGRAPASFQTHKGAMAI